MDILMYHRYDKFTVDVASRMSWNFTSNLQRAALMNLIKLRLSWVKHRYSYCCPRRYVLPHERLAAMNVPSECTIDINNVLSI